MEKSEILPEAAFAYRIRVQPHHTDYAGVVWHGTYVAWMEEARVECLQSHGIDFAKWVEYDVDLPVIDLSLQYRQPLTLGMEALIKTWPVPQRGIRIIWHYDIQNKATQETCVTGKVTLVPVDRQQGKVWRQLPEPVRSELAQLYASQLR